MFEDDSSYDELDDGLPPDIDATVEAIRAAWHCVPSMSLSQLLDSVTPMPFCDMTNSELIESLNEFIHQNQ